MNQNYNIPLFVFDGTGVDPEDIESTFAERFKKEYPTSKEAVLFAKAGGSVMYKEVDEDGNELYVCGDFKLATVTIQPGGVTDIVFTYPDDESETGGVIPIYVSYTNGGGDDNHS